MLSLVETIRCPRGDLCITWSVAATPLVQAIGPRERDWVSLPSPPRASCQTGASFPARPSGAAPDRQARDRARPNLRSCNGVRGKGQSSSCVVTMTEITVAPHAHQQLSSTSTHDEDACRRRCPSEAGAQWLPRLQAQPLCASKQRHPQQRSLGCAATCKTLQSGDLSQAIFHWKATSAKLLSLRECNRSRSCAFRCSSALRPIWRC